MITSHNYVSFSEDEIVNFLEKRGYKIKIINVNEGYTSDSRPANRMVDITIAYKPEFNQDLEVLLRNHPDRTQFSGKDIVNVFLIEYKKFVLGLMEI